MSPSHKGRWSAFIATVLGMVLAALPARAQLSYDAARQLLDLAPDPIERSPRQVGMGGLSLVLPDHNNRITMWDFAGNPTGVFDNDSSSTFEVRPKGWSTSSARNLYGPDNPAERQTLDGQQTVVGYEVWRRTDATAFGAIGDLNGLTVDTPYDDSREIRSHYADPNIMVVLNGKMPYILTDRMRWALRGGGGSQSVSQDYRLITSTSTGQYLDQDGQLIPPPNVFDPDQSHIRHTQYGVALSYRFAPWMNLALGGDYGNERVTNENVGDRYVASYEENRPYAIGQASWLGKLGHALEFGADGRWWSEDSKSNYVFTSSGGIGAPPIAGRGSYLTRGGHFSDLRTRARWLSGGLEVGGAFDVVYRGSSVNPPPSSDLNSFNNYRTRLYYDTRADSIALPDSVSANTTTDRVLSAGGGIAWHFKRHGSSGVEYHWAREQFDQQLSVEGTERQIWDVRWGLEYPLTQVLGGRVGYSYQYDDRNKLTAQNEFKSQAVTLGLGLAPQGAHWKFESGFAFEWGWADYGSPAAPHFSRQELATQIAWGF